MSDNSGDQEERAKPSLCRCLDALLRRLHTSQSNKAGLDSNETSSNCTSQQPDLPNFTQQAISRNSQGLMLHHEGKIPVSNTNTGGMQFLRSIFGGGTKQVKGQQDALATVALGNEGA
jgi:hypothetical protein